MIPSPPPGAAPAPGTTPPPPPPPLPPAPARRGPRGLPAVTWGLGQALLLYLVGNLLIGQILVVALLLAVMGAGAADPSDLTSLVAGIAVNVTFVAVIAFWLGRRHPGWLRAIGFRFRLGDILRGVGAGVVLYPAVAIAVGLTVLYVFRQAFGDSVEAPEQLPSDLTTTARAVAIVFAVVAAPITEELFFRGVLYRSLRDRAGMPVGIIGSALLFGLVHYVPAPAADSLFLITVMVFTGVGLALIYEWRGNLVVNVVAHMVFNVIGLALIFGTS